MVKIKYKKMKVIEHIKNTNKTLFPLNFSVKGESIQSLYKSLDPLMEFQPPFIDVTYHREEYVYKRKDNGLLEEGQLERPGTVGICRQ